VVKPVAYILLGDPAWLPVSVRSYYPAVSRIVASYDESLRSWSGEDMRNEMETCLRLLADLDIDHKVVPLPGPFAVPGEHPQLGETRQRQASLDLASESGDWVVQLDTDEVVTDLGRLFDHIVIADHEGAGGLEYPARWLYTHVRGRWFLEMSTRRLRTWSAIPGPVAVRAGTRLTHARQTDSPLRRVRFGPALSPATVPLDEGILHFSMVRTPGAMAAKAKTSPHAPDLDWSRRLDVWERARRAPLRTVAASVARPEFGTFRPVRLPARYDDGLVREQTSLGDPGLLRGR
jgi:hypothetical protein